MSEEISNQEFERLAREPTISTIEGWCWSGARTEFEPDDFDLLDLVLSVAPVLRATAVLGKIARQRTLSYPVASVDDLVAVLGEDELEAGGFVVSAQDATEVFPVEIFPLAHEGEFLSAVHLALLRCRTVSVEVWQRAGVEQQRGQETAPGP